MKSGTATIIGRPNSGKSTLLNAIIGQKISIVSEKPQTTRHRILGILTEERGQVMFVDTPGIHKPNYRMNRRMLQTVYDSLDQIDLVLLVVDGSIAFGAGEAFALDVIKQSGAKALLFINKIDKFSKPKLLPIMQRYGREYNFLEIIPLSALTRENLDLATEKIFEHLRDGERVYEADQFTDRSERFIASEYIREKILARTREELPYTTAVIIRTFDEGQRESKKLVRIEADILVEKKSQQIIILGARGDRIRDIGTEARLELEILLGCRVFLGLTVRTVRDWRNNDMILDELELGS